jgi:hypothetical protein
MLEHKVYFIPSAPQSVDAHTVAGEPSHIHIPRPSRRPRPEPIVEVVAEAGELLAPEDLQAA